MQPITLPPRAIYAQPPRTRLSARAVWRRSAALWRAVRTLLTHTLFLPQVIVALPILGLLRAFDGAR